MSKHKAEVKDKKKGSQLVIRVATALATEALIADIPKAGISAGETAKPKSRQKRVQM